MSKVREAYARCKPGRDALVESNARAMECTEDKSGMVWERWLLPNGTSAVLVATPVWWNVFIPATDENSIDATVAAIKAAATRVPSE